MKSFNRELKNKSKKSDGYERLDKIKDKFDLMDLLENFFSEQENIDVITNPSDKTVYHYEEISRDDTGRFISVWIKYGKFGQQTRVYDTESKEYSYHMSEKEAVLPNYLIGCFIPKEKNKAFLFTHSIGINGVKSIFDKAFVEYYKEKTELVLQINQLTHGEALKQWFDGKITEVEITKFKPNPDITNFANMFGMQEVKEKVLLQNRAKTNSKLKELFNQQKYKDGLITLDDQLTSAFGEDMVVIKLENDNGKKHKINISSGLRDSFSHSPI